MISRAALGMLLARSNVIHTPGGFLAVDTEDLRHEVALALWDLRVIGLPVRIDSRAPTGSVVAITDEGEPDEPA